MTCFFNSSLDIVAKRSWRKANWTLTGRTGNAGSVKDGSLQQENRIWNCEASDFLWKPDAFCIVWR
ncbi:hypothetical protein CLOBOL_05583 [Enterocloster bolteae ATCC BAA-613]|uniref:Uncharacterized protein n=1 Tax=Enterocloster bolteae (strain ATCC BAA-613 / DSM 15670 / CCUG 46953 / JCM 12243 / WAL 16351) TaxID=411902 RepID=A8S050_ENTBW|nr:hypothetical protein CLOBOL_05583 [Enterocloster bolteae ATCC BAA-613]